MHQASVHHQSTLCLGYRATGEEPNTVHLLNGLIPDCGAVSPE